MQYKTFNKIIFILLSSLYFLPVIADEKTKSLQLYWELEIPQDYTQNIPGRIHHIARVVRTDDGEILALGNGIVPLDRREPGANTFLHTKATILAAGLDGKGNIWAGGLRVRFESHVDRARRRTRIMTEAA